MIFRDVSEKKKEKKKKKTRLMTWRRTRARNIGWSLSCFIIIYIPYLEVGNSPIYPLEESAKERTNNTYVSQR